MKIKFRGVRKDNGEFVFGDLLQQPKVRIVNAEGEFEINPETVSQFVGYDIDNHELYTGDNIALECYRRCNIAHSPIELEAINCENLLAVCFCPSIHNKTFDTFDG